MYSRVRLMIVNESDQQTVEDRLEQAIHACLQNGLKYVNYTVTAEKINESPTATTRRNIFQVHPVLLDGVTDADAGALFSAVADKLREQNRTWQVEIAVPN